MYIEFLGLLKFNGNVTRHRRGIQVTEVLIVLTDLNEKFRKVYRANDIPFLSLRKCLFKGAPRFFPLPSHSCFLIRFPREKSTSCRSAGDDMFYGCANADESISMNRLDHISLSLLSSLLSSLFPFFEVLLIFKTRTHAFTHIHAVIIRRGKER